MRSDTIRILFLAISFLVVTNSLAAVSSNLRSRTLQDAGKEFIFNNKSAPVEINKEKSNLGEKFFEDKKLSFNGNMSCATCHIDRFGSSDGLRNSIGVGGVGEGPERVNSNGFIVPRNSLPLWGRGEKDFSTFFWDGKVESSAEGIKSQFGDSFPSEDPLIVAVHLPFVEIREMILDDEEIKQKYKTETVGSAQEIYEKLVKRVRDDEKYKEALERIYNIKPEEISFFHIADSVAEFIRDKFKLKETKFEQYVFGRTQLSQDEIAGGIIFFGKGKCASCHSGRHFSDFSFHSIPFPQAGFGKNGFGVDYGRFNVTQDSDDIYKFRTPPLANVSKTAPYGHSGSIDTLKEAIVVHFDPLRYYNGHEMTALERNELYKKLLASSGDMHDIAFLDDEEVEKLEKFLRTLSYE